MKVAATYTHDDQAEKILSDILMVNEVAEALAPKWKAPGLFPPGYTAHNRIASASLKIAAKLGTASDAQAVYDQLCLGDDPQAKMCADVMHRIAGPDSIPIPLKLERAQKFFRKALVTEAVSHVNGEVPPETFTKVKEAEAFSLTDAESLVPGSAVQIKPVRWLWKPWLPLGELVLLEGDQGQGKSLVLAYVAARLSRGLPLPPHHNDDDPGAFRNSLICLSEGKWDNQVGPRLEAMGADQDRIFQAPDGLVLPQGLERLERLCVKHEIKLICFDVIKGFIGVPKFDDNSEVMVRQFLMPLHQMARRNNICVVLVRHYRKSAGSAMDRGGGSGAWARQAQIFHCVGQPEGNDRPVLACAKSNLAAKPRSLEFSIAPVELKVPNPRKKGLHMTVETAKLDWGGETDHTADDIAWTTGKKKDGPSKLEKARDAVKDLLSAAPMASLELKRRVMDLTGVSSDTFEKARKEAGALTRKGGLAGGWITYLPDADEEPA